MPYEYKWIEPEVAVHHRDITVFHTYRDNEADQRMSFWFVIDTDDLCEIEDSSNYFDVRTLPEWTPAPSYAETDEHILSVLRQAIENGTLPPVTAESPTPDPVLESLP